jgi:MFS family permease
MREVLRRRDFRLVFVGLSASMFGDSVMLFALAIWMKLLTGSNSQAGLIALALIAPSAVGPLLGWVVDRYRRRPFLIVVNLASAALLTPLYLVRTGRDAWLLYAVTLLYGVSYVVLSAGLSGLLKELLPGELLIQANGLLTTSRQGLRLIGPLVGAGVLAAFGPVPVISLDLASFLVAAAAVAALRVRQARPARGELHWLTEMTAGLRHLVREAVLLPTVLSVALATLTLGCLEAPIFAYVDRSLHRPPTFLGVLATLQGVGAIIGGLSAPRLARRLGEVGVVGLGVGALGAGTALLVPRALAAGLAGAALIGVGLAVAVIGLNTLLQLRTPDALMGRVAAAAGMALDVPQAASVVAGAVLVAVLDYRVLFAVAGAVTLLDGLYLLMRRDRLRSRGDRQQVPDSEPVPALSAGPPAAP